MTASYRRWKGCLCFSYDIATLLVGASIIVQHLRDQIVERLKSCICSKATPKQAIDTCRTRTYATVRQVSSNHSPEPLGQCVMMCMLLFDCSAYSNMRTGSNALARMIRMTRNEFHIWLLQERVRAPETAVGMIALHLDFVHS
jgi:hypothetical protein